MSRESRLLSLFGSMVMGTLKRPETWKESDIRQKYNPYVDQWESFFSSWYNAAQGDRLEALRELGIDIINFENPYEQLLLEMFGLIYGPEAREEISCFLWENNSMIYYYPDGTKKDVRSPRNWALYFKENYDTADISVSLN